MHINSTLELEPQLRNCGVHIQISLSWIKVGYRDPVFESTSASESPREDKTKFCPVTQYCYSIKSEKLSLLLERAQSVKKILRKSSHNKYAKNYVVQPIVRPTEDRQVETEELSTADLFVIIVTLVGNDKTDEMEIPESQMNGTIEAPTRDILISFFA